MPLTVDTPGNLVRAVAGIEGSNARGLRATRILKYWTEFWSAGLRGKAAILYCSADLFGTGILTNLAD